MNCRKSYLLFAVLFLLTAPLFGNCGQPDKVATLKGAVQATSLKKEYYCLGFLVGSDIMLSSKKLSETEELVKCYSGMFGFYFRGGHKHVWGEVGLQYAFYMGEYNGMLLNGEPFFSERVETRYLEVPLKFLAKFDVGKIWSFYPGVGFIYKPLVHVTKNTILYGKENLQLHNFQFVAGVEVCVKFFTVNLSYRRELRPFFSNQNSLSPSYLNISVGTRF